MASARRRTLAILASAAAGLLASTGAVAAAGGWTIVSIPEPTSHGYLMGVDAPSDTNAWAVGVSIIGTPGAWPQALIDHWNGSSWQALPTLSLGNGQHILNAVSASSATDAWAVGYQGTQRYQTLMLGLHWNGSVWSANSPNDVPSSSVSLVGIADVGANRAFAVGNSASLATGFIEQWNGSGWRRAALPDPNPAQPGLPTTLTAVSADAASDAWAVGTYLKDNGSGVLLSQTYSLHWNGSSWSVVYMPLEPPVSPLQTNTFRFGGLQALSPADVWVVGSQPVSSGSSKNAPLTEHWDGTAWSIVSAPNPSNNSGFSSVTARAGNDVWAVGTTNTGFNAYQTLTEHWNGSAWSVVSSPNAASANFVASTSTRPGSSLIWAVGRTGTSTSTYLPFAMEHS